jgi:hypothetical protein
MISSTIPSVPGLHRTFFAVAENCPHCAELVKDEVLIYRYCQRAPAAPARRA